MIAISLLDQLKWGVNSHLIKIHDKYKAFDIMALQNELKIAKNDIQTQKTKLNIEIELARNKMLKALNAKDDALEEKEKALKEKDAALEEKEEAQCIIENQRGYIKTLHKRLSGLPMDEESPTPSDLSEQLDLLQSKPSQERKREYNTDTDSSLGSLDVTAKKAKKAKAGKGRKISLDNVPKKTPEESKKAKAGKGRKISLDNVPKKMPEESPTKAVEESPAPKFSYGLDSSQSTTSIQSTQENEF